MTPHDPIVSNDDDAARGAATSSDLGARAERTLGGDRAGGPGPRRGIAHALVPAASVLALVALVAALSSGLPGRVRGSAAGLSAQALLGDAAAVLLALALGAVCFLAYDEWASRERVSVGGVRRRRRRRQLPRLSLDPSAVITPLLALALVALVLAILILFGGPGHAPAGALGSANDSSTLLQRPAHASGGAGHLPLNGLVFAIVAALVVIAGVVLLVRERRRRADPIAPATPDPLAAAVEESLEDLESEPDPRRAVIKAYDRMELALTASGTGRDRAETPLEYLRRALAAVHASQHSIRRLTDLFEQARFSRHVIDSTMKQEAIEALTGLRSELDQGLGAGGPA